MGSRPAVIAIVAFSLACAVKTQRQTVHSQRMRDARGASVAAASAGLSRVEGTRSLIVANPGSCFFWVPDFCHGGGTGIDPICLALGAVLLVEVACGAIATGIDVAALPVTVAARYAEGKRGEAVAGRCMLEDPAQPVAQRISSRLVEAMGFTKAASSPADLTLYVETERLT